MFEKVKNVFRWLPILWKDHNFDHEYIFIVLRHKIKTMRDLFLSEEVYGLHAKDRALEMSKAIKVLDRLIADDYLENAFKLHDKKWGELDWENGVTRTNINTEEDKINEAKEAKDCYKLADNLEAQDLDYLFSSLRQHITTWWD